MRDEEVPSYLERAEPQYARQLVDFTGMPAEDAQAKSRRDHEGLFPGGEPREDLLLFVLEDEAGSAVGRVMYSERPAGSGKAWLWDILIEPDARGRGYGREGMRLFEEDARARGLSAVSLNVFGGNEVARTLYRSLGYAESFVEMTKPLDEPK
jgi:ribosomal protein S18 acetylase RimI-like enzyme